MELLYVACILHDLGLTDSAAAATRFEVEGADSALAFLEGEGLDCGELARAAGGPFRLRQPTPCAPGFLVSGTVPLGYP